MKTKLLIIAFSSVLLLSFGLSAQSNGSQSGRVLPIIEGGVGPAMGGSVEYSAIPLAARKFIDKNFRHKTIATCEKEFAENKYEVELNDGTDLEFNGKGEWIEVDAGIRRVLERKLIKDILPDRAYKEISRRHLEDKVESVERDSGGYKVEFRDAKYDDCRFTSDGRLISLKRL